MDRHLQAVAVVAASALLLFVLEMVRRRRLLERYALLWLFSTVVLLVLAAWRDGLDRLAGAFGISDPPNALFFVAFVFVIALLLHFSAAVSNQSDQIRVLAQRLALTEERLAQADLKARRIEGDESAEQAHELAGAES